MRTSPGTCTTRTSAIRTSTTLTPPEHEASLLQPGVAEVTNVCRGLRTLEGQGQPPPFLGPLHLGQQMADVVVFGAARQ